MCSRSLVIAFLVAAIAAAALPARDASASYASTRPGLGDAPATMQVFGAFSPGMGDDSRLGYGIALRWRMSNRVALGVDAARLSGSAKSISPFGAGILFGPGSPGALHPWIEIGAAYVRVEEDGLVTPVWALSSAGNLRDSFGGRLATESRSDAVGPYFGTGVEWSANEHFGVFGGVRAYSWKESPFRTAPWDGVVTVRSGLTFSF